MVEVPDQRVLHIFAEDPMSHEEWMSHLRQAASRKIESFYSVGKDLGRGPFSKVMLSTHKKSCKQYAIKGIDKLVHLINYAENELKAMRMVDHPNLVKVVDFFDTPNRIYIVSEYLKGGTLFEVLSKQEFVSEQTVSMLMLELLKAVGYLHQQGLCHRDIKPGNLICTNSMFPQSVKLADYGFAAFLERACEAEDYFDSTTRAIVSAPSYTAPEVFTGTGFNNKVDIWSCGVILHVILSARLPFPTTKKKDLLDALQQCRSHPSMNGPEWRGVSEEAKDLVGQMLRVNPDERVSAVQALQHPWITSDNKQNRALPHKLSGILELEEVEYERPKVSKLFSIESSASQASEGTYTISSETHKLMNVQKTKIMYRGANAPNKGISKAFESSEESGSLSQSQERNIHRSDSDNTRTIGDKSRSSRGLARTSRGMSRLSKGLRKNVTLGLFSRGGNKDGPSEYW